MIKFLTCILFVLSLKANETDLDKEYLTILNVSANSRVIETLPRNCKYVTTDMYTAASASSLYLKGEALAIYNMYKKLKVPTIREGIDNQTEAQINTFLSQRKSLWELYKSTRAKLTVQQAAKNGFVVASTYALKTYGNQKEYFYKCYNNLEAVKPSLGSSCGGCKNAITESQSLLQRRQKLDEAPLKSQDSENQSLKIDQALSKGLKNSCGNWQCGRKVSSALRDCNRFRDRFWVNQVYCYPEKVARDISDVIERKQSILDFFINQAHAQTFWDEKTGLTIADPKVKAEFSKLKTSVAGFLDKWVAHAKGRAYVYKSMALQTDIAMKFTKAIMNQVDQELKHVEKQIQLMNGQLEKLDKEQFEVKLPVDKSCLLPKCLTHKDILKLRHKDISKLLTKTHLKAAFTVGTTVDEIKSGKLSKKSYENLEKLNTLSGSLENYEIKLEASVNKLIKNKGIKSVKLKKSAAKLNLLQSRENKNIVSNPKTLLNYLVGSFFREANNSGKENKNSDNFVEKRESSSPKVDNGEVVSIDQKSSRTLANEKENEFIEEQVESLTSRLNGEHTSLWRIISNSYLKAQQKKKILSE